MSRGRGRQPTRAVWAGVADSVSLLARQSTSYCIMWTGEGTRF